MQVLTRKVHDVCVIGSGPAGGFVAKELTEAGAEVLLLEAGREVPPHEFAGHKWPYEFPLRGTWAERQRHFYPDEIERHIRYTGPDRIGVDRIRVLGGRSTHWNAVCLRFAEDDFREGSIHGQEPDWPITYADLAPYYSYVERVIGVCGTREGLAALPDGEFYGPPPRMRCAERLGKRACDKLGIPVIPVRKAMLVGRSRPGRMPCHYCSHCMQGCEVGAIFTSANTLIPLAQATGRLTLRTNALVRRIETDREGRATGVAFVDRVTGQDHLAHARIVVVCAGAVETPRLLLNSTSPRFPNGLANSSGLVGCYLTGHVTAQLYGYLTPLVGRDLDNQDGATDHTTIPRFRSINSGRGYVGGFMAQIQFADPMYPHHASRVRGFGTAWKRRVRELQPAMYQMGGYGKLLARRENRVTVDPDQRDPHGIPIPVVHHAFSDNDKALWKDMVATLEEIFHTAGTELFWKDERMVGFASHEVGTCRMGTDPKTSVLTPFCRSHDVPNLFVADGSPFVTFPEKNPTLTIMALAVRTARYIAEERRKNNL
ncbi:MAG TPA: GMC family oxidoreductase [Vicinamibacterales bacterium]